ncbi:MAG: nucleotidyltransferase domain-containing protein [Chitinophagaceae bacterium]|nr:nucleotidyltransferase domain-containing protein [Chitinophagaceae bacterium]
MLTTEEIKRTVAEFFKDKPVKKVYLFGSYARGEADETSDVDLLVEVDNSQKVGLQFFGWNEELNNVMQIKVDVVSANGLSPYIAPYINKDKRLIYEA